jgi:Ca-activated chloride channel family protein
MLDLDAVHGAARALGRLAAVREGTKPRALPLARVDIRARVADRVAEVTLQQTFVNDHDEPIEAVYIFPLSGGCAVSDFTLTVAGATVKGVLAEREEARAQYLEALEQGKRAALMEQERSDVFTITVGNLPPHEEATVRLVYSERLPFFEDGRTELRLPLVLAPRYIPGTPLDRPSVGDGTEPDTDEVPDASRITPPRLAPGFDPKTALTLEVELLGAAAELACSQHAIAQAAQGDTTRVALSREDERLDRDFVLRWRLVHDDRSSSLVYFTHADGRAYGVLSLMPSRPASEPATARDVVFVFDRSGSMAGMKIASAARACGLLLRTLGPGDRFAILAFDDRVEWFGNAPELVVAGEDGIARGERWLRDIEARGGTEIDGALEAAFSLLDARAGRDKHDASVVLITDGEVGNEGAVLRRVGHAAGHARVFAVGVDTAVNAGFLTHLARAGRGTAVLVEPGTALEGALVSIGRDIGRPLVTDLTIEDGDRAATSVDLDSLAPSVIPDLFGGRSAMVAFRAAAPRAVRVRGRRRDGTPYEAIVEGKEVDLPAIAHVWARERITDLEDRYRLVVGGAEEARGGNGEALRREIVETSLAHRVLSRFTAFVAVDDREAVADPSSRRKVVQPVHLPATWSAAVMGPAPRMAQLAFGGPDRAALAPMARGGFRGLFREVLDSEDQLSAPAPSPLATLDRNLLDELARVAEAFAKEPVDPDWRSDEGLARLRSLRDRVADLAEERRANRGQVPVAVQAWLDRMVEVLDRLLHLVHEQRRLDAEVRAAATELGQLAHSTPGLQRKSGRWRFWESGV